MRSFASHLSARKITSAEKETTANGKKSVIIVRLGTKTKAARVSDFNTISKPSRHFYKDYRSLRSVRQGHGMAVLSTSKGIMSERDAKKQKVGGEYLFEIW